MTELVVIGMSQPDENGDHKVVVTDGSGRTAHCRLPAGNVQAILAALQAPRRGQESKQEGFLQSGESRLQDSWVVEGHQVLISADGAKGLALKPLGSAVVAFAFPDDDTIRRLARELAELASVPRPAGAH